MLHIHVRIDLCLHHVLMTEKASYPDWTGSDLFDNMMRVTPNIHSNIVQRIYMYMYETSRRRNRKLSKARFTRMLKNNCTTYVNTK